MCGIAGFIGFSDGRELAEKANRIQLHRGPDHQGVWSDSHISISHQRLSIIDLSARSNQPMVKHGLVIAFNGEIYNYRELKSELTADHGVTFDTGSDTEVVLEAYRTHGSGCVKSFIGMFAFAIYDQASGTVFLARDQFGIKPLFYELTPETFAFASELKTLVKTVKRSRDINMNALVASVNYLWIPGDESIFTGILKLPPGCCMTVDREWKTEISRYHDIDDSLRIGGEEQAAVMLEETLVKSVSRHMVSDVPVSSFLSGGLDSSLIAVLAGKHTGKLSTYTIATREDDKKIEQMPADEVYARRIAGMHGFDHNEIVVDSDILEMLPAMVRTLDEPIGDPAAINTYLICNAAHKRGVKVLLSGMGADEVFCGYRRQKATLLAERYRKYLPGFLRVLFAFVVDRLPVRAFGRGLRTVRWAKKFLSIAGQPDGFSYMQSYSYYSREELQELLGCRHKDAVDQLYREHDRIFNEKYSDDPVNRMCNTDINMFMVGLNLAYTDRASMSSSVEVRVPFIDVEMIRVGMMIPGDMKYRNGESKYILKKVAEKYLPRDIVYRPKASFGVPLRSWISGPLRGMVDDLLSAKNLERRGLFSSRFVRKLVDDDRAGLVDNAYRLYQLLTIELWLREYFD